MAEEQKRKAEEQKRKAEEAKRLAEQQKRQAEEDKRKAEQAREREQAELALQEALAEEQLSLDLTRRSLREKAKAEYVFQIRSKVERNWIRPAGTPKGLKCLIRVEQIPGGEVVGTRIVQSSGNVAFDRSVEIAVNKSSPLPQPTDPTVFARVINFEFDPEG